MSKLKLIPIADRVVVDPDPETATMGGFVIPDEMQETVTRGVIVAVGPGNGKTDMQTAVGDRVLFDKHTGTGMQIKVEGKSKDYMVCKETELLTILKLEDNESKS